MSRCKANSQVLRTGTESGEAWVCSVTQQGSTTAREAEGQTERQGAAGPSESLLIITSILSPPANVHQHKHPSDPQSHESDTARGLPESNSNGKLLPSPERGPTSQAATSQAGESRQSKGGVQRQRQSHHKTYIPAPTDHWRTSRVTKYLNALCGEGEEASSAQHQQRTGKQSVSQQNQQETAQQASSQPTTSRQTGGSQSRGALSASAHLCQQSQH